MTMLSKKSAEVPVGYWGVSKGYIRMIHVAPHGYAVYAIEESPGYRTIRYNRRKYRIFCPWVYFIVRVYRNLNVDGSCLYAFFSKKRLEALDQQGLMIAPFSNGHVDGGICMPQIESEAKSPLELALEIIWHFWASEGQEYGSFTFGGLPEELSHKVVVGKYGGIFSRWSKLTPNQVVNLDFDKSDYASIESAVRGLKFNYM